MQHTSQTAATHKSTAVIRLLSFLICFAKLCIISTLSNITPTKQALSTVILSVSHNLSPSHPKHYITSFPCEMYTLDVLQKTV